MADLWVAIGVVVSSYVLHELGHYYIAWKNGLNPKFFLGYNNLLKMGFGVTYSKPLNNPTNQEVVKELNIIVHFASAGSIGIIPVLLYGSLTGDYSTASMGCVLLLLYSLYETTTSIQDAKFEYSEVKRDD